jgi:mannose-6-phosphate isomerase
MDVYPLIFQPIFKPKIWGGRRLERLLGKRLPEGEPIGESWEIADLENDQSVVTVGPARGKTLGNLVKEWGADLLGGAKLFDGRFPLLIKFLDANNTLSVQVHPDEAAARRLGGHVRIKNEAWYVIDADPGGFIYRGLGEGVDAEALRRAIDRQEVESTLNRIPVKKGQCYYLPSGTIHALGTGVLVAEVQTPSDVTYRVYDWNRIDPSTGSPRELHVEQALECIRYDTGPIADQKREHTASVWTTVSSLVRCESFTIERVRMIEGVEQPIPYQEMVIWMVLEGRGGLLCDGLSEPLDFSVGNTVLLPAGIKNGRVRIHEDSMWLEVTVPVPSSLSGYERPDRAALRDSAGPSGELAKPGAPKDPGPH